MPAGWENSHRINKQLNENLKKCIYTNFYHPSSNKQSLNKHFQRVSLKFRKYRVKKSQKFLDLRTFLLLQSVKVHCEEKVFSMKTILLPYRAPKKWTSNCSLERNDDCSLKTLFTAFSRSQNGRSLHYQGLYFITDYHLHETSYS